MRPKFLLFLSLTAYLTVQLQAAAVLPSVISSAQVLENACQCECCYQLSDFRTECLSPNEAFFDVPSCSRCTVAECSARFPTPCSQPSSVVHAKCTAEHGAFFRLVPALFVLATIALLIYGFFFKKFDGYHREQNDSPIANQPRQYNTFHNNSNTPNPTETTKLLTRQPHDVSSLPTIQEEEEENHEQTHQQTLSNHSSPTPQTTPDTPTPPSQPLLHDTDVDTRVSEVATVDSDSTYARDLPMLSEIPQPDAYDADIINPSVDVQHSAEANPTAIFERDASVNVHHDVKPLTTDTVQDSIELDSPQLTDAIDQAGSVPIPDLTEITSTRVSEIPQPDAHDADTLHTTVGVQHAPEAEATAIFERGASDAVQQDVKPPVLDTVQESIESHSLQPAGTGATDLAESVSIPDLDKTIVTEPTEVVESKVESAPVTDDAANEFAEADAQQPTDTTDQTESATTPDLAETAITQVSEIPQPDALEDDTLNTDDDLQHTTEATPIAIFERDASDGVQQKVESPPIDTLREPIEPDSPQPIGVTDQTETLPLPDVDETVTESTEQVESTFESAPVTDTTSQSIGTDYPKPAEEIGQTGSASSPDVDEAVSTPDLEPQAGAHDSDTIHRSVDVQHVTETNVTGIFERDSPDVVQQDVEPPVTESVQEYSEEDSPPMVGANDQTGSVHTPGLDETTLIEPDEQMESKIETDPVTDAPQPIDANDQAVSASTPDSEHATVTQHPEIPQPDAHLTDALNTSIDLQNAAKANTTAVFERDSSNDVQEEVEAVVADSVPESVEFDTPQPTDAIDQTGSVPAPDLAETAITKASETMQLDAHDDRTLNTFVDVQHATEAEPAAISDRGTSDIVQQDVEVLVTDTAHECIESDSPKSVGATSQTETLPIPDSEKTIVTELIEQTESELQTAPITETTSDSIEAGPLQPTGQTGSAFSPDRAATMSTQPTEQIDSAAKVAEADEKFEEYAQTAVGPHSILQTVDTVKANDQPENTAESLEEQFPTEDQYDQSVREVIEPVDVESQSIRQPQGLVKETEEPATVAEVSEEKTSIDFHSEVGLVDATDDNPASDADVDPSLTSRVTEVSLSSEGPDTVTPDVPQVATLGAPVGLDESPIVVAEIPSDSIEGARTISADNSATVQSKLEPSQKISISEIPNIANQGEGIEETAQTENEATASASDYLSITGIGKDTTAEDMQSENIEPVHLTRVPKPEDDTSLEAEADVHVPDVSTEAMSMQQVLEEGRVQEEESTSLPEEAESSDPIKNVEDTLAESMPDSAVPSEKDSAEVTKAKSITEKGTDPETDDAGIAGLDIKEQLAKHEIVTEREGKSMEPADLDPESLEDGDLSVAVNSKKATEIETSPTIDVMEDPEIDVQESQIEADSAGAESGLLAETDDTEFGGQVVTSEDCDIDLSVQQIGQKTDDAFKVQESQHAEDLKNEQDAAGVVETRVDQERGLVATAVEAEHFDTYKSDLTDSGPTPRELDTEMPSCQNQDLRVSDTVSAELEVAGSEDGRLEVLHSEHVVEDSSAQGDAPTLLESALEVSNDVSLEPIDETGVEGCQQSSIPQEVGELNDIESSITETAYAEEVAFMEHDAVSGVPREEDEERVSKECEKTEETKVETDNWPEIDPEGLVEATASESAAKEVEAIKPEIVEPTSDKPEGVLQTDVRLEATESEAVVAASEEPSGVESTATEKGATDVEAVGKVSTEPMNIEPAVMESAAVELVTVETEVSGPVSMNSEVEERDIPGQESEGSKTIETEVEGVQTHGEPRETEEKATFPESTTTDTAAHAITDSEDVEATVDEAAHSEHEAEAQLHEFSEEPTFVNTERETKEYAIESSATAEVEVAELIHVVEEGSDLEVPGEEAYGFHPTEEAPLGPKQVEEQESEELVGNEEEDDEDADSTESEPLKSEAVDSAVVCTPEDMEAENVEKMNAVPENLESSPVAVDSDGSEREAIEGIQESAGPFTEGSKSTEVSSAKTPTLASETAETQASTSEVAESPVDRNELRSADVTETETQERQMFDERNTETQTVEQYMDIDELEDTNAVGETTEVLDALEDVDESEIRTDDFAEHDPVVSNMSGGADKVSAGSEHVTVKHTTDDSQSGAERENLNLELPEESPNVTNAEMNTTVAYPEEFDDQFENIDANAPELLAQSKSEASTFERKDSLVAEILESAEIISFAAGGQSDVIGQDIEPAGPSSLHLLTDLGQHVDDIPGGAVPLAELEAAEAGAASDFFDENKEDRLPSLVPTESRLSEDREIETSAGTLEAASEGTLQTALTIEEHASSVDNTIDFNADTSKNSISADMMDMSAQGSEGQADEASNPQILEASEATLSDELTSEVAGSVEYSKAVNYMEKSLEATEKELSNDAVLHEVYSAPETTDEQ